MRVDSYSYSTLFIFTVNSINVLSIQNSYLVLKFLFRELPHLVMKLDDNLDLIVKRQYAANVADLRDGVFFAGYRGILFQNGKAVN